MHRNPPVRPMATALLSFAMLVGSGRSARAQGVSGELPLEALVKAPRLAPNLSPSFTPDGKWLAYTAVDPKRKVKVDHLIVPWYSNGTDVWLAPVGGGEARNLTGGVGNNWGPSWSPDGRRIAFLSDRPSRVADGLTHVWVWERPSGALRQVSDLPVQDPWGRLGQLEWLGDNRTVVVKTYPEGMSIAAFRELVRGRPEAPATAADTLLTVQVLRYDSAASDSGSRSNPFNLNPLSGDLALLDVETGSVRPIVRGQRICTYALSPDRRRLAWAVATRFAPAEPEQILVDLFAYDLEGGESRQLVKAAPLVYVWPNAPVFSWSPTSRALAYRTDGPAGTKEEVFVVPVDGGAPRRVAEGPPLPDPLYDGRPLWSDDGERVFFVRAGALWQAAAGGSGATRLAASRDQLLRMIDRGGSTLWSPDRGRSATLVTARPASKRMGFARVDLGSGIMTQLLEEEKWYDTTRGSPPAVTPDGRTVAYVAESQGEPAAIWASEAERPMRPRRITRPAPQLERTRGGVAKVIEWRGLDGDTLRGALVYPGDYRPGTRYPLIVKVYGGTSVSDELYRFGLADDPVENVQVFASRGYAVLLADSKLHVGTPMLDLLKTVMPGVDRVIEMGVADPARIGITGHSYGGYNTLALIAQSTRFKAAVERAGMADLIGAYANLSPSGTNWMEGWAERGQGRMGGSPWDARERYIENSPFFYLDRVQTPVLIVHGTAQANYPFLADQVFNGLRRLGKRVEYARYVGEDHWEADWSLPNQIDYLTRVTAWFDTYLKPEGSRAAGSAGETPRSAPTAEGNH
jgi:dipeptidyl aminopeptidase/acylaminoacyl peptidase